MKIFMLVFSLMCWHIGQCQNQPVEDIFCHVSSTNLIVGERLYFSAHTFPQYESPSNLLYAELVDSEGNGRQKVKIQLIQGRGHGYFTIPTELASGIYRLVAYTRWMMNFDTWFSQPIVVLNPYRPVVSDFPLVSDSLIAVDDIVSPANLKRIKTMEEVSIQLDVKPGSYSLSVSKLHDGFFSNIPGKGTSYSIPSPQVRLVPEYQFGVIQGRVREVTRPTKVMASFPGHEMEVGIATTDSAGHFALFYDHENIVGDGFLRFETGTEYSIELEKEFYPKYPSLGIETNKADTSLLNEIKERSIQNQLMRAYRTLAEKDGDVNSRYLPIEQAKTYRLDDFKRFESMRETFIELIFEVAVSKNESDFQLRMRSRPVAGVEKDEIATLCLLDGIVVDSRQIFAISPYQIEKIEVFSELYFLGSSGFDGVISVHTRNGDLAGLNIGDRKLGIRPILRPDQNQIRIAADPNSRAPFYHDLLYWDPIVNHTGGELSFGFSSSETTGIYEIRLSGTDEEGNHVNQSQYLSVSN